MSLNLKDTIIIDGILHTLEIVGIIDSKIMEIKLDGRLFTADAIMRTEIINKPDDVWTKEEDEILRQCYPNMSAPEIVTSEVFHNRSERAIYDRAKFLEIRKSNKEKPELEVPATVPNNTSSTIPVKVPEKVCSQCRVSKPLSEFNKSKNDKDGIQNNCRICQGIYFKEHMKEMKHKRTRKTILMEKPEQLEVPVKSLPDNTGKAPNNTQLFLNWIEKRHSNVFDINDFLKANPSISKEQTEAIITYQINKKKIMQLSNTRFIAVKET